MDFKSFVDRNRSLLIAPAGYGKTHTIVECLKYTTGKQLILTHTHAGISSIKDKISKSNVNPTKFHIETISSFAQKYVEAFYRGNDLPKQEDSKQYHPFVIQKASHIVMSKVVQSVIRSSYTGFFVDEYQDCTIGQHNLILALAAVLPVHILGDPLQGIFDFNGATVDFENDLATFDKFPDLTVPNRWYQNGNNRSLGDELKTIRTHLEDHRPIVLSDKREIGMHVIEVKDGDLMDAASNYRKTLSNIIINKKRNADLESLLIIVPEYEEITGDGQKVNKGDIRHRAQLKSQIDYTKSLLLLEAIDDKLFYALAKEADELIRGIKRARKKVKRIREGILDKLYGKTEIKVWFNEDALKIKKSEADKVKSEKVNHSIDEFVTNPSSMKLMEVILEAKTQLSFKHKRDEVLRSFVKALRQSQYENITVYEAMKRNRNHIRRSGRKVFGKCIGTTLLTKGLEFDTVVILDAHKFDSPNHLYVALTRCCKKLIVFTAEKTLYPFKEVK